MHSLLSKVHPHQNSAAWCPWDWGRRRRSYCWWRRSFSAAKPPRWCLVTRFHWHQSLCTPPTTMLQFAMAGRPSISSRPLAKPPTPLTLTAPTRTELPRAKEEGRSRIPRSPQKQDMKGQRPSLFYYAMMDEDGNRCRGVFGFRLHVLYQARLGAGTVAMIS